MEGLTPSTLSFDPVHCFGRGAASAGRALFHSSWSIYHLGIHLTRADMSIKPVARCGSSKAAPTVSFMIEILNVTLLYGWSRKFHDIIAVRNATVYMNHKLNSLSVYPLERMGATCKGRHCRLYFSSFWRAPAPFSSWSSFHFYSSRTIHEISRVQNSFWFFLHILSILFMTRISG